MQDEVRLHFRKFREFYSARGYSQKELFPEPLYMYSQVSNCTIVRSMLILHYILGLHIQIIDFTNSFVKADILRR